MERPKIVGPVRVMVEYGHGLPLWASGSFPESVADWLLPSKLLSDLLDWQDTFDSKYHPDSGWPAYRDFVLHYAEGMRLTALVREELADYEVTFDCWAVVVRGHEADLP